MPDNLTTETNISATICDITAGFKRWMVAEACWRGFWDSPPPIARLDWRDVIQPRSDQCGCGTQTLERGRPTACSRWHNNGQSSTNGTLMHEFWSLQRLHGFSTISIFLWQFEKVSALLYPLAFFTLFAYGLFNDIITGSGQIVSNDRVLGW